MKRWINIYSFICKADIQMDITIDDLKIITQTDENLRMLWKKSTEGECGFECTKDSFTDINHTEITDINNDDFNAVYLTCDDKDKCKTIAKRYGIQIITIETIDNHDHLYDTWIQTINQTYKPSKYTNWNKIATTNHNCNALAIIDGYLLQNESCIQHNLIPILNNYLPSALDIPFNISIFTNCRMRNKEGETTLDLKKLHTTIKNKVTEIRPNLNFTLGLFNMNSKLHDRTLLTNYLYLDSGAGFDLISKDKEKKFLRFNRRTKITAFYPFAASNSKMAISEYYDLCETLNHICQNKKTDYYGDKQNRILDSSGNNETVKSS
ncbi:hypothetical protein LJC72_02530 [Bacteroides sp. OttesenSCG-928-D19]|nr:hypothetical protein [Bacteroides sp. OttesenSCG-928-D19]